MELVVRQSWGWFRKLPQHTSPLVASENLLGFHALFNGALVWLNASVTILAFHTLRCGVRKTPTMAPVLSTT